MKPLIFFICIAVSCSRSNRVVFIFENSSNCEMELIVKNKSIIIDTIIIKPIYNQSIQTSIRKCYLVVPKSTFTFFERNSGIELKKKFDFEKKIGSFVVLGLGENCKTFRLDTITYQNVPPEI